MNFRTLSFWWTLIKVLGLRFRVLSVWDYNFSQICVKHFVIDYVWCKFNLLVIRFYIWAYVNEEYFFCMNQFSLMSSMWYKSDLTKLITTNDCI